MWTQTSPNWKPKYTKPKTLDDKLDVITSKYVRLRDEKCVLCGSTYQLTNGHIFSRNGESTRWDISTDGNCHTLCWKHNLADVDNNKPYRDWYKRKFGERKFKILERRYWKPKHWDYKEKKELYQNIKAKYENLKRKKDIGS